MKRQDGSDGAATRKFWGWGVEGAGPDAAQQEGLRKSLAERLDAPDLKLGDEAFDMVLMIMTYHDIYYVSESNPKHPKIDRDHYFAQIHRSLKPGGILAIVDHSAKRGTEQRAAQGLHRIDEAFAKKDIEAAGFVFDAELNALRNSDDERTMLVFDDRIRRRTDRFVYRIIKAKARSGTSPKGQNRARYSTRRCTRRGGFAR